ncbi:MAG: HEAT repeat domain-containing protein, partial [Candidatus Eisenbacteria bacterium]|nr:HEAT repeat domain-containing protein [Candidatus Eisenbacteria bacterium]
MGILKRFQADRHVRQLQAGAEADSPALREAREQIEAMGSDGARVLFDAIARTPASPATLSVLAALVTPASLPLYVSMLRAPLMTQAEAAGHALAASVAWDPLALLPALDDPKAPRARIERVLEAQAGRVPPAQWLRALPALSREVRPLVLRVADRYADVSVIPELIGLASNVDWTMRVNAARMLARFPSNEGAAVLTKLVQDEHATVRHEAVRAAAASRATVAIGALCTRLRDSDLKVQTAAIEALIAIGDVSAVPHLLTALQDESEFVRRAAVEVLNEVVTIDAIKDLVGALRDADWWVRVRAADALGTLGGPRVVDAVLMLVRDPDESTRRYAIEILNAVPDSRAVPALIEALDDDDWWVRERAVDALARTRSADAIAPLRRLLRRDPRTIPLCARAFGAIGTPECIEPLEQLVGSDDAEVRREALAALVALAGGELPDEPRQRVLATLAEAGVKPPARAAGQKPKPMPVQERSVLSMQQARPSAPPVTPPSAPTLAAPALQSAPSASSTPLSEPSAADSAPLAPPAGVPSAVRSLDFQHLPSGTELLGRFRIVNRIGGGGFGTVYRAEDLLVNEELVLKVLSPQLSHDPQVIKRFVQELKLTRRVSHPTVIRIHDLLDLGGAHAISMEYFAGRDLGIVLHEDGALSPERTCVIAEQVLEGLVAAHAAGVLHRDIKPGNILVGDGDRVRLVDFGLASATQMGKSR